MLTQREEVKPGKKGSKTSERNTKAVCFKCGRMGQRLVTCLHGEDEENTLARVVDVVSTLACLLRTDNHTFKSL